MQFKQYPSYKNSGVEWLGDVPEHWYIFKSNKIFKQSNVRSYESDEQLTASQKYGVIPQSLYMKKEESKVVLALSGIDNFKHVDKNDFVISLRSFQGGIELCFYDGCVSPAYTVLKPNKVINYSFWSYLFKSTIYISVLNTAVDGIREGKTISYTNFGKIYINIPPLSEQAQIANYLDTETTRIDNLIAKQEKLIELLEEQRKSIISHAVTKGLNPNAPMKDSGVEWLGDVPEHWSENKIKFVSKLITDKTANKSNVIALENIESWTAKLVSSNSDFDSDGICFKKNDVLFGKLRPYLAKVYLAESKGEAIGDIYVLRPNNLINPKFLKFFMLSEKFIDYVNSSTNGTKMPRANWDFIGSISIFLPHIKIQHEIVEYLDSAVLKIELIINKQKSLIEKLKEYRASIISHAVTGKIDVREFGA